MYKIGTFSLSSSSSPSSSSLHGCVVRAFHGKLRSTKCFQELRNCSTTPAIVQRYGNGSTKTFAAAATATTGDEIFHERQKVAVIGAGSFGSAMVKVLSQASAEAEASSTSGRSSSSTSIMWYARRQSIVDEINTQHTNEQYFPRGSFDGTMVTASNNLEECVQNASTVLLAVPSPFLSSTVRQFQQHQWLEKSAVLVSVMKSLHYEESQQKLTTAMDEIHTVLPDHAAVVLSGPNLYREMTSDDSFAEATIGYDITTNNNNHRNNDDANNNKDAAKLVQKLTSSRNFQTSLCNDRLGVELCGGFKNVLSLAVGYCEGLKLGWNVRAAILRAGMHEMTRLIQKCRRPAEMMSAAVANNNNNTNTVFETSAGMGDVILTCAAGRGRLLAAEFVLYGEQRGRVITVEENRERWDWLERNLFHGMKLPDWHNAQYVYRALKDWKCEDEFPLFHAVYKIGFEGSDPKDHLIPALRESLQRAGC